MSHARGGLIRALVFVPVRLAELAVAVVIGIVLLVRRARRHRALPNKRR